MPSKEIRLHDKAKQVSTSELSHPTDRPSVHGLRFMLEQNSTLHGFPHAFSTGWPSYPGPSYVDNLIFRNYTRT